ncbi:hypothetical protein [Amycolatopsis sp. NPDC059021]|uniref:hypothetical protein n=1 Tax=Amycolatopsis sp. NPDC059021 TaxID=3346704 RepID=UPI00366D236E
MGELLILGLSLPVVILLFVRYRRSAYPSLTPSRAQTRQEAIEQAVVAVRRLCGADVSGWRSFGTLWFDDEIVDKLHQLDAADRDDAFLRRWGLRGAWRVRFVRDGTGSVLVGLSARGEVLLFDIDGPVRHLVVARERTAPELATAELLPRLDGGTGGLWATTKVSGQGELELSEGGVERTHRLRTGTGDLRIDLNVETVGTAVLQVDSEVEVVTPDAEDVDRAEQRDALAGVGGMLGAVVAMVLGVAILAFGGGRIDPFLLVVLTVPVLLAVLGTEYAAMQGSVVNGYDGRLSWSAFRVLNVAMSLISAIVSTSVVVLAVLAGTVVAQRIGLPLLDDPLRQAGWGAWLGAAWLGLAAAGYALLARYGIARVTTAPDRRSLRRAGVGIGHVVGITVQSAISEETVFRLLGVPVCLWLTGEPLLAAAVPAALWAAMHSGSVVRPRWIRMGELFAVGTVLGVVVVEVGLIAALLAHVVYNAASMIVPLLAAERTPGERVARRTRSADKKAHGRRVIARH